MKRILCTLGLATALLFAVSACGNASGSGKDAGSVYIYNFGDYLDVETLEMFEEETGIHVVYDEYETNEIMFPKVAAGATKYDVICPSDYMIQKMVGKDMLQELDWEKLPNARENIGKDYLTQAEGYDPGNLYSVPYCFGTVGILYNKTMVDDPVDSWSILWNEKYKNNILMQDSVRDSFMVALKLGGSSMNASDRPTLEKAMDLLIEQKPLVQAYVNDEARDKMIGDEAALAMLYSGDVLYAQNENENLEYAVPKEGTNVWIDAWVVPKNAENVDNAHAFIDFMCRPDIALINFEYLTYSTPNVGARELIEDEEVKNSPVAFPDLTAIPDAETFSYLGEDAEKLYDELWKNVKSH